MAHQLRSPRLLPGERRALAQEMLLQQHQFRENQALLHGLSPPAPPVMLGEEEVPEVSEVTNRISESVERVAAVIEKVVETPGENPIANAVDRAADTLTKVTPEPTKQDTTPGTWSAARVLSDSVDNVASTVREIADDLLAKSPVKKTPLWQKLALGAALLGGGAAVPFVGDAIWGGADDVPPVVQTEEPAANLLTELSNRGYDVAPTDLGEDIKRAFRLNPELREQLIDDVKRTLELQGVRPVPDPAAFGA